MNDNLTREEVDRICDLDYGYWTERGQAVVSSLARQLTEAERALAANDVSPNTLVASLRGDYEIAVKQAQEATERADDAEEALAEAERENGRLREALLDAVDALEVALGKDRHYLKSFPRTERHHVKRVVEAARQVLNTGDVWTSPPKDSGEALNPGGSEESG